MGLESISFADALRTIIGSDDMIGVTRFRRNIAKNKLVLLGVVRQRRTEFSFDLPGLLPILHISIGRLICFNIDLYLQLVVVMQSNPDLFNMHFPVTRAARKQG